MAVNCLVPVIGRTHPGFDGHVAVVHQQGRRVADAPFAELVEVAVDLPFHQALQTGVQSGVDAARQAGVGPQDGVREVRGVQGQRGIGCASTGSSSWRRSESVGVFRVEPGAGELRARGEKPALPDAAPSPGGGPLRNHGEGDGFAQIDLGWRLAEVDAAGRADSLDVAAERRQVQIGFQDAALRVTRFEPQGRGRLFQFAGGGSGVQVVDQPGELHGEGGAALAALALARCFLAARISETGLTPGCQ